jgi:hypothetical protein
VRWELAESARGQGPGSRPPAGWGPVEALQAGCEPPKEGTRGRVFDGDGMTYELVAGGLVLDDEEMAGGRGESGLDVALESGRLRGRNSAGCQPARTSCAVLT